MSQVLDYSAGFPGAKAIKQAGYGGAVRYIGFPERRKCTTREELADFTAQKIGMALVFEDNITHWRGGQPAGRQAAQLAIHHALAIGFPTGRPVYLAIDQDVVKSGEFETMLDYLRGANSVLGAAWTGVYGEADVIDRARDAGVAHWFWQTAAWSRGRRTSAHLFQRVGTVTVGGIACDINDVLVDDWGQHNYEGDIVDYAQFKTFMDRWMEETIGGDNVGKRNYRDAGFQGAAWAAEAINTIKAVGAQLGAQLTGVEAKALAAIAADKPEVEMTPEDLQVLLSGFSASTKGALREVLGSLDNS